MKKTIVWICYAVIGLLCAAVLFSRFFIGGKVNPSGATDVITEERGPRLTIEEKVKLSSNQPNPNPVVGAARGTDYADVTNLAIKNAGGLENIIKKGDVVLIKPNLGASLSKSGSPDNTDYRMVQEIVAVAKACGASRVVVAEASYSGNVFKHSEYDKLTDVELIDMNQFTKEDCYLLKADQNLTGKKFFIPKIYMDADVVISAAKLKTYIEVGATLSLKNVFGVPPSNLYGSLGGKMKLHQLGVEESIVDLNLIRKPDFAVIEGIVGGEGVGPSGNRPVESNIILAGADLVATDTVALTFMGFKLEEVGHVVKAAEMGLGICDLSSIQVVGIDLEKDHMTFERK